MIRHDQYNSSEAAKRARGLHLSCGLPTADVRLSLSLFFILIHLLLGHLLQGSINGFLRNCRASLNQQNRKYHSAGC